MAKKPNYRFEKRQKELARKSKKEEKKLRKTEGTTEDISEETSDGEETVS